jgi:hypothetical protein
MALTITGSAWARRCSCVTSAQWLGLEPVADWVKNVAASDHGCKTGPICPTAHRSCPAADPTPQDRMHLTPSCFTSSRRGSSLTGLDLRVGQRLPSGSFFTKAGAWIVRQCCGVIVLRDQDRSFSKNRANYRVHTTRVVLADSPCGTRNRCSMLTAPPR